MHNLGEQLLGEATRLCVSNFKLQSDAPPSPANPESRGPASPPPFRPSLHISEL